MVYVESITAKNETRTIRDLNGQQMLATIEASTTASKAYAVGDYLIINDKVYKVTVAIASGGTITVGTNVTETKVGAELTDLNRQISESITPAIEEIETALDGKAPVIINIASGEIASFADGADGMPVKSLVANIEPVQDLHGYDYPWPRGGGVNQWDEQWEVGGLNGSNGANWNTDTRIRSKNYIQIKPSTGYYISYPTSGVSVDYCFYDANKEFISSSNAANSVITSPSNAYFLRFATYAQYGTTYNHDISINYPATVTTYSPYSNICPISGHTGASVTRTGKNLLEVKAYSGMRYNVPAGTTFEISPAPRNYIDNGDGTFTVSGLASWEGVGLVIPVPHVGTYYFSCQVYGRPTLCRYNTDETFTTIGNSFNNANPSSEGSIYSFITNITIPGYILISISASNDRTITLKNPICQYAEPITDYEPYQGNTISITFPSSAGTVYGGTLTLNPDRTGTLVVTHVLRTIPNNATWHAAGSRARYAGFAELGLADMKGGNTATRTAASLSNVLPASTLPWASFISSNEMSYLLTSDNFMTINLNKDDVTSTDINDLLTANPMQLWYPIASPYEYSLTADQMRTLYGTNNIWTDVGTVDVEYLADTKLYIEQLTKPTEDDMTADHAIASGTFFMIGNNLYLATSQIAAGGTITPGTNAKQLSLADALNQLNTL